MTEDIEKAVLAGHSCLVTGQAGTGKSCLARKFFQKFQVNTFINHRIKINMLLGR